MVTARTALPAVLAALAGLTAGTASRLDGGTDRAGAAARAQPQALHVGDEVVVDGHPIGCQVARVHGDVALDCRRGGPLEGTYGTLLSARRAEVARFSSNRRAKVVFTARQRGAWRRCGG